VHYTDGPTAEGSNLPGWVARKEIMRIALKWFTLSLLVMLPGLAGAAVEYGTANVEKGSMTVVREGRKINYAAGSTPVSVVVDDVIMVQKDSRVVLRTQDKAVVTIGANAAFQVRPWESQERSGTLRALFGRFRVKATELARGDEFNVKTATATIGIKGTEYTGSVTSQGDAVILVSESTVQVAGLDGVQQPVTPDLIAVTLNSKPGSTAPALVPDQLKNELAGDRLDSPSAVARQASALPAEEALVKSGVISQKDLAESKLTEADFRDAKIELPDDRTPEILYPDKELEAPAASTAGKVYLNFER